MLFSFSLCRVEILLYKRERETNDFFSTDTSAQRCRMWQKRILAFWEELKNAAGIF